MMTGGEVVVAAGLVALNQAGYAPNASKFVFVATAAESISVVDIASNSVRFAVPLSLWQVDDPSTGRTIRRGDFSPFTEEGTYRIRTSGGDYSEAFEISDTVYNSVSRKTLKAFYFQRCGTALLPDHAGTYWHPQCHMVDALLHASTDSSGFRYTVGGWHDAGDYGKYIVNAGVSLGTLLMAYEYFPSRFDQDNLHIPESGNGIPDILDEMRRELSWFLSMQRADGGVHFKVTRLQFEPFIMPHSDNATRYIYQVSSTATGSFAAVMARAARIYAPFDSTFATQCRSAAIRAWTFLAAHPSMVPAGGFRNPPGTGTGEYGDTDDTDERLWAAAELFVTTGSPAYNNSFVFNYSAGGVFSSAMSWQNVRSIAQMTYLRSTQQGTDQTVTAHLRQSLASYCQSQVTKRNSNGYHVVLQPGAYTWGSNSAALNSAVLLIMGFRETQQQSYLQVAADQFHYILGANAHGMSFVTGVGTRHPMHPHHRPSAADGIAEPVPGLLVGGPDQYRSDPVLQALFSTATPPAMCYIDSMPSYASNEIAINWNAPLAFVAGYFNGEGTTAVKQGDGREPSGFLLLNNYPNPFNGITQISFFLPDEDDLNLRVTDVAGRTVAANPLGRFAAGGHMIAWEARYASGMPLSSGVYFMALAGRSAVSNVRKLILLK